MAVIKIVPMPGAVGDKGDEGAPGARGPQGERGLQGTPGTNAVWSYQGAWNSSAAYAVGDIVVYQGQLYYTKSVTTAGTLPTNTTKFDLIAAKGADGTNGTNGTNGADGAPGAAGADFGIYYLGNYNPTSGYLPNIAVVRGSDGQLYLAKASGQLGDPVGNTAQWEVWIPKGQDGAPGATPFTLIGAYDNGAAYNLGIAVYYNGGTYVRTGNPLNPGYPPTLGAINESWTPIAEKGADFTSTNGLVVTGLIDDPAVNPAGTMALSVQGGGYTALMDLIAHSATFNGDVQVTNLSGTRITTIETPTTINNDLTVTEDATINGLTVGRGSGDTVFNTALGVASLLNNTTGDWNTALGIGTLQSNTTGESNTAVGVASLLENTIGSYNVATGYSTLRFNTTGNWNTADGYMALHNNTTGGSNTAVGHAALFENTTGTANTALGLNSLVSNTTGTDNTSVGHYSLYENIVGISNTAIGNSSLQNNTGNYNTAVGKGSLFANTTGDSNTAIGAFSADANTTGIQNTSVGSQSLGQNQTGIRNTALGADSLYANTEGDFNTAVGNAALGSATSPNYNTAVGHASLLNNNGAANTAIGVSAGENNINGERNIFIGYQAGQNETGSDKLYIDVTGTATPLIHGDFATNTLTVNGNLNVSTGATGTFQTPDAKIVVVTNGIITSIESLT